MFDWDIYAPAEWHGYGVVSTGAGHDAPSPMGGIGPARDDGGRTLFYVYEPDLPAALRRAVELGGSVVEEPMPLPEGYGSIAFFADPTGTVVGLWDRTSADRA